MYTWIADTCGLCNAEAPLALGTSKHSTTEHMPDRMPSCNMNWHVKQKLDVMAFGHDVRRSCKALVKDKGFTWKHNLVMKKPTSQIPRMLVTTSGKVPATKYANHSVTACKSYQDVQITVWQCDNIERVTYHDARISASHCHSMRKGCQCIRMCGSQRYSINIPKFKVCVSAKSAGPFAHAHIHTLLQYLIWWCCKAVLRSSGSIGRSWQSDPHFKHQISNSDSKFEALARRPAVSKPCMNRLLVFCYMITWTTNRDCCSKFTPASRLSTRTC